MNLKQPTGGGGCVVVGPGLVLVTFAEAVVLLVWIYVVLAGTAIVRFVTAVLCCIADVTVLSSDNAEVVVSASLALTCGIGVLWLDLV